MLVMEFNPWNYDPQIKAFFFFLMSCLGPGILSHHSNRKVTKTLSFSIADTFFFFLKKRGSWIKSKAGYPDVEGKVRYFERVLE